MPKAYRKRLTYGTCSCGQVLYGNLGPTHLKSTRHLHGARIKKLLENGATLLEVGNKYGITRERVRQIASALGLTPAWLRMRERAEKKALDNFFSRLPHTRLGRFLEAAVAQGFTDSQLVPLTRARFNGQFHSERAWVNSKLVAVRASYGQRNDDPDLISVHNTRQNVDYVAYELPDGRWLFLEPWASDSHRKGRLSSTMFTLREVPYGAKGYTYTKRHHFRERIEAWHLLRNDSVDKSANPRILELQ